MQFGILGPFEVSEDGRPVEVTGGKQRALLAMLLLNANHVVSVERLVDGLWEDDPPETAAKAVQVYVSHLRKLLGRDRVVTKAPGYVLHVDEDELDVDRFRRLAERRRFREALELWHGQPLAEFAKLSFAQAEIARLEQLRLACVEGRVASDLERGGQAELVGELEALVREHPLREGLRVLLMLALYRSGRQAEALDVYQDARRALVEELGIEPGRALRELHQQVLRQDSLLDPAAALAAPEPAVQAFVGRASELGELVGSLDDAFAGHARLVLLVGEPGIGKSRLAEEVTSLARARGADVLVGRCWEAGGAPAYWPWVQSLRAYVEGKAPEVLSPLLGAGAADLAQIVPELRELIPDLPSASTEIEGARFRLFDAVARFLRNVAATRPLLLVLDDLHVADEPSLLLLRFVAGQLGDSRVLVVGTYRDVDPTVSEPLDATLAELARERITRRLQLHGLSETDVSSYVELVSGAGAAPRLIAAIHEKTEGNPLFVGEVVRLLAAEGRLSELDERGVWALGVPQGVREVIGRRVRHVSEECLGVLTLASVLGREFALDALRRVTMIPADRLLDVLDEAVAARLLASSPEARGRLRFSHALIRETIYEGLTTPRRVQLHRQVGEALDAYYGGDPEPHLAELAYHFFEAAPGGDVRKALDFARRAGQRAVALLAYEEGARLYDLALQALELTQPADPVLRCELRMALGDALARAGSTPDAGAAFLAAASDARENQLSEHLARAALGYGGRFVWLRAGRDTRLVPLLEEALATVGANDSILRVRLLARLAGALRDEPSLEPRSSLSREAVAIARRLGDKETLAYALAGMFTATMGTNVEELAEIAEEVTVLATETGDPEAALQACWLRHIAWLTLSETERVSGVVLEYRELAEALKQPSHQWYVAVMLSVWALFHGEFEQAEQLVDQARHVGLRAQEWDAACSQRLGLFALRREQGRLDEVDATIKASAVAYTGYRVFRCLSVLVDCELGRMEAARAGFEQLADSDFSSLPRDGEWLFNLCVLAEVAARLYDGPRAAALYDHLLPYAGLNPLASGEIAAGSAARYLGILAASMSRWEDAERHFKLALEMNERMGARPWLAHTQEDYGRMLAARAADGDRERAGELLEMAVATYRELGMHGSLARAEELMASA